MVLRLDNKDLYRGSSCEMRTCFFADFTPPTPPPLLNADLIVPVEDEDEDEDEGGGGGLSSNTSSRNNNQMQFRR